MLNTSSNQTTTATTSDLTSLVDEFTELHQTVKQFEPTLKRHEELKKLLASQADSFGSGEVRLQGSKGYAVFTKPSVKRTLTDIAGFMKAVGVTDFLKCVSVSITKADKLLNESQKQTSC